MARAQEVPLADATEELEHSAGRPEEQLMRFSRGELRPNYFKASGLQADF